VASDVAFSMSSTVSLESVCVGTPAAFMLIGHTPPHQAEAVAHLDSVFGPAAALPAVPRLLVSLRHRSDIAPAETTCRIRNRALVCHRLTTL